MPARNDFLITLIIFVALALKMLSRILIYQKILGKVGDG
jgi:hypothetical protein